MKNSNFQTILIVIFCVGAVIGVLIFSGLIKLPSKDPNVLTGEITIWGTFDRGQMSDVFKSISDNLGEDLTVKYIQKSKANYQNDLVESFARGGAPDLFILTSDMIIQNEDFIYKIPYESISERDFKNTFINGANIYMRKDGIIGMPLVIDPLVLFYNKNILANEGVVDAPIYWDELFSLNSKLTKKKNDGSLEENMIALGEYSNIRNVKEIIATLLLQSGNPVTSLNSIGNLVSFLTENPLSLKEAPTGASIKFFTEFSNPSLSAYSWSKSMPDSFDRFTSDKLAFYIGFASELFKIEKANPNLSFDVKEMLMLRNIKNKKTYGNVYTIVVNKRSQNLPLSFAFMNNLIKDQYLDILSKSVSLPPATKSLLSKKPKEAYLETFWNSALISTSWLDPDYSKTNLIFGELIDNVMSNRLSIGEAIIKADGQLNKILK